MSLPGLGNFGVGSSCAIATAPRSSRRSTERYIDRTSFAAASGRFDQSFSGWRWRRVLSMGAQAQTMAAGGAPAEGTGQSAEKTGRRESGPRPLPPAPSPKRRGGAEGFLPLSASGRGLGGRGFFRSALAGRLGGDRLGAAPAERRVVDEPAAVAAGAEHGVEAVAVRLDHGAAL